MRNLLDLFIFVITRFIIAAFVLFVVTFVVHQNYPQPDSQRLPVTIKPTGYTEWLFGGENAQGILRGDFGVSFTRRRPVIDVLVDAFLPTFELVSLAFVLTMVFGIPLGALMAFLRRWKTDVFVRPFAILGLSMPVFWLALMLVLSFAIQLKIFPVGGRGPLTAANVPPLFDRLNYLILPLASMAIFWTASIALNVRHAILSTPAKASDDSVVAQQILQVVLTVLQALPVVVAGLVSSSVVVEVIFGWPGVGRLIFTAAISRDYPVIAAIMTIVSVWITAIYLIANIIYGVLVAVFRGSPHKLEIVTPPNKSDVASSEPPPHEPESTAASSPDQPRRIINQLSTGAAILAAIILAGIVVLAFLLPALTHADPTQQDLKAILQPPGSGGHVLGTDSLGRDQLARVLYGGQATLGISFLATSITLVIGAILGIVAGLFDLVPVAGRVLNVPIEVPMAAIGIVPSLILLTFIVTTAGHPPDSVMLITIFGLIGWPSCASIVRARTRTLVRQLIEARSPQAPQEDQNPEGNEPLKERVPTSQILLSLTLVIVYGLAISMAAFILMETALSFLGLGLPPPQATWGSIFQQAAQYLVKGGYLVVVPGLLITLVVFCLYIIAMRIQESFDFLSEA